MAKRKLNAAMIGAAATDAPLKENNTKSKPQYDRISLATTPAQKMQLRQKAEEADEVSLSRFIIKVLKKHGYLD